MTQMLQDLFWKTLIRRKKQQQQKQKPQANKTKNNKQNPKPNQHHQTEESNIERVRWSLKVK